MMKQTIAIASLITTGLLSGQAAAVDIKNGKELHDANCIACHSSLTGGNPNSLYTRADRRVETLEELEVQVRRCKTSLGVPWPDDMIQDVVAYLNDAFYKIDK